MRSKIHFVTMENNDRAGRQQSIRALDKEATDFVSLLGRFDDPYGVGAGVGRCRGGKTNDRRPQQPLRQLIILREQTTAGEFR